MGSVRMLVIGDNMTPHSNTSTSRAYWRLTDIRQELGGISRTQLYKIRRDDASFPKPTMLGNIQLWSRETVLSWMANKADGNE